MSGFTIDPVTQLWMAEPEVWNDLIKVKPQAKIYMQTPVLHYDKMVILYGKDRATGNHSVTASELRKRSNSIDVEDFTDSTHDIDPTMSQFSAQNTSHYVDDDMEIIPPSPSEGVSPSLLGAGGGNKKSKKSIDKEKEIGVGMQSAIEKVADAIKSSAELIAHNIKASSEIIAKKASISPTGTYQMLLDLDFQPPLLHNIYSKLVMNVDFLNAVLGCPVEHRRDFILSGILGDLRNFNM
ncbi:hypothetical protein IHE45_15G055200 [Dioscorea alata]|uniref:Uncharacterized protein n=1 Tax=Dioscorea alata TaxID=55571 RepID=A0ACB7ULM6_DIOAL|nr:hypothetical protein IHE45_15G055200 [Dioscorea alata]